MATDRSLVHDDFLTTLRFFETRESGTAVEKDLARVARELYERTYWHPPVIEFVNEEASRTIEASS